MTHQAQPLKILAIGSPLSELSLLISKITAINGKHGPFDACIIVGDLFKEGSDGSEVEGLKFPVPTYFTLGKNELPSKIQERIVESGGEVVNNLVFLGKSAVLTTAQGLKVACAGGSYDQALYDAQEDTGPFSPIITQPSITNLLAHSIFNPSADPSASLASARESTAALPSAFNGVDLLLLSSPPPSLGLLSPSFPSLTFPLAAPAAPLADLVRKARPRYMFWGDGDGFWEREPWGWTGATGKEERWTRAVKLGALGGDAPEGGKKARWFYAFSLPPQTPSTPIPSRPANTTLNPYVLQPAAAAANAAPVSSINGKKRAALDDQDKAYTGVQPGAKKGRTEGGPPPDTYVCKICSIPGHWIQDCPQKTQHDPSRPAADHGRGGHGTKPPPAGYVCRACGVESEHFIRDCPIVQEQNAAKNKRKELGPAECWFCLSNPKVTKHLIVAIGSETYVTLPKGQIIPTTPAHIAQGGSTPLVPGGGHVLIIPIAHHPTLLSIPADDAMNIVSELEAFKSSLRNCYASYGAVPVTFEVGRLSGRGGHAHVQIVPIPKELTDKVGESFRIAGEKQGIDWEPEPERALARVGAAGNYFKVECPDGKKMVHLLKGNFDLQFGRMVLASLLGLHHRIDWKDCFETEVEEKEDAQKFKKAFAPFQV